MNAKPITQAPISRWLNLEIDEGEDGVCYRLGFGEQHIGNPSIRAIHGGVIAAFLEVAAQADLTRLLGGGVKLHTISSSIDYLASSRAEDMAARVKILRSGRRIAFVEATGWQGDPDRPVASARFCIRILEAAAK